MFQLHYHTLRPLTTAHLAQTMSLLSLTAGELRQQIDAELAANPALELVEERRCPNCHRLLPGRSMCPVCSRQRVNDSDEPIVFVSPRDVYPGSGGAAEEADAPEDSVAAEGEELPVYVFRQIAPDISTEDRRLAAYLLTNLDEDGLLSTTIFDAARYLHVLPSRLEQVQRIIQRADPLGVCSVDPQQALLVQLEVLAETRTVPALAVEIVREGMNCLSRRQYAELARQLNAPLSRVQQAALFITENLNPYPARSAWGQTRHAAPTANPTYYHPDMIISHLPGRKDGPLMVEIIMPLFGTLRINPLYRQAIQEAGGEQKDALRGDLDRASLFVKCLQQRNHTIQRLMQRLVVLQRDFILRGEKYMQSITRAQLALELEVHESTISRAVAGKAVQMPNRRIIPLSNFFDRSLNVRTVLREIIAQETRPLSDSHLVELLAEQGFQVARRTVAKYRAMEGILPANLRQPGPSKPASTDRSKQSASRRQSAVRTGASEPV
jgi:RNA polymerase sigma-54 factor